MTVEAAKNKYIYKRNLNGVYLESPNNRETTPQTRHLLPSNETSSVRSGLHLSGLLAKGYHGNSKTNQSMAKAVRSLQPDGKAYGWRQHLHTSSSMEKLKWCLPISSSLYSLCPWYWKPLYMLPGSKHLPILPLQSTTVTSLQDMLYISGTDVVEITTQPLSDQI